ncbi:MAG: hypothetical protein ABSG88_22790 [Bradyrhizobium sp.]
MTSPVRVKGAEYIDAARPIFSFTAQTKNNLLWVAGRLAQGNKSMRLRCRAVITAIFAVILVYGPSPASSQSAPQCSSLPASRDDSAAGFEKAWAAEKARLSERIDTLKSIQDDLKASEKWTIGDPGSARELAAYMGKITRTTTDLIKDLGRLAGPVDSVILDTLDKIQAALDGERPSTGAFKDRLAELSPYTRILVATYNLAKNVQELKELPGKLDEARKTVSEQMEALNNQLAKLQPKLDQMKLQDQDKIVDRLFARATQMQRTCEDLPKKAEDCEKQRKAFVSMMCWGGSQADKEKCVSDSYGVFDCRKYGAPTADIRLH